MKKVNNVSNSIRNATFYLLLLLNLIVIVVLFVKPRDVESNYLPSDKAISSIIRASDLQYKSEGLQVFIYEWTDSLLLKCLKHGCALILRIGDKHCEVCVTEALMDFNDFISQNDISYGIILASYDNTMDFEHLKNRYKNISVMNIGAIDLPVDEINNPYLFLVDRSMLTDMVFVHQKEFPEKTKGYFEAVQAKLIK
ncbi:MAG: hypothetical protein R6W67_03725 [Bacteroidales bacterium]